jgi:hypothetical protein
MVSIAVDITIFKENIGNSAMDYHTFSIRNVEKDILNLSILDFFFTSIAQSASKLT